MNPESNFWSLGYLVKIASCRGSVDHKLFFLHFFQPLYVSLRAYSRVSSILMRLHLRTTFGRLSRRKYRAATIDAARFESQ